MLRVSVVAAVLAAGLTGVLPAHEQDPPAPVMLGAARPWTSAEAAARLTGSWKLNDELSPSPRAGSSPSATSRGGGRGRIPGVLTQSQLRDLRVRAIYRELTVPPQQLSIVATLASVAFKDDGGEERVIATNNKREKLDLGTTVLESKSRWDAAALIVEIDAGPDLKLTETFELAPTGKQLLVTLKTGEGATLRPGQLRGYLQRVYDRIN